MNLIMGSSDLTITHSMHRTTKHEHWPSIRATSVHLSFLVFYQSSRVNHDECKAGFWEHKSYHFIPPMRAHLVAIFVNLIVIEPLFKSLLR